MAIRWASPEVDREIAPAERSPFSGARLRVAGKPSRLTASKARLMAAIARFAVQLSREETGRYESVHKIAADALAVFGSATDAARRPAKAIDLVAAHYSLDPDWLGNRYQTALATYAARPCSLSVEEVRYLATVLRLAVQLSRERAGLYETILHLTTDAIALTSAALKARRALEAGNTADHAFEETEPTAKHYAAEIIRHCDRAGMVFGIRFSGGRFSAGSHHIFFVA